MIDRVSQSSVPDDAVEVITETYETGTKMRASYFIDGREIGFRYWDENGILGIEFGLKDGLKHGSYRTFDSDGQIEEDATYIDGKEHGETIQYHDGARIGSYVMDHGTGVDLWWGCIIEGIATLSEERHYLDGQRHGFERWWNGDDQTIYEESHFQNGIEHGIFREWNHKHRLRRGFPRYYVKGQCVTKRQYEHACRNDPTLPPYRVEDNQPYRTLPTV